MEYASNTSVTRKIVAGTVGGIITLIFIPAILYLAYELWTYRYHIAIRKRHIFLSYHKIFWFTCMTMMTSLRPTLVLFNYVKQEDEIPISEWSWKQYLIFTITSIISRSVLLISILRYWHLVYDMKCIVHGHHYQWYAIINENSKSANTSNFLIKHRKDLGNDRYTIKIIYFISIVLPMFHLVNNEIVDGIVVTITFFMPAIIFVIIFVQMCLLQFYDSFYVRQELKYEFIAWVVAITTFAFVSGITVEITGNSKELTNFFEVQFLIIAMMLLFHVWLLTKWTLNKLETLLKDKSLYLRISDISFDKRKKIKDKTNSTTRMFNSVKSVANLVKVRCFSVATRVVFGFVFFCVCVDIGHLFFCGLIFCVGYWIVLFVFCCCCLELNNLNELCCACIFQVANKDC